MYLDTITTQTIELIKRHGIHHTINIKYGYIVFALTVGYILFREGSLYYYNKCWSQTGRSTTRLGLVNYPIVYPILFTLLICIIIALFNLHVTEFVIHVKRCGRIAYCLVPLNLFLALKPSLIPIDNYLDTVKLHKWISRIILGFVFTHSIGFMIFFGSENMFKMFRVLNLLGFIMFILAVIMFIFWKPIRDFNYKIFYMYHNFFMISFIILTFFHARPGVSFYFIINIILLATGFTRRVLNTQNTSFSEIFDKEGSTFRIIRFSKKLLPDNYLPGCHIRIGYSKWSLLYYVLPSHPYTVATTFEDKDASSSLVIKKTSFNVKLLQTYSIQPFFKSSLSLNFFQTAENVNIVCGGSGVSLGIGIFQYFKRKIQVDGKDIKLEFVWITRSEEDLFILKKLNVTGVKIFITNSDSESLNDIPYQFEDDIELNQVADPFGDDNFQNDDDDDDTINSNDDDDIIRKDFVNTVSTGVRPNLNRVLAKNLDKTIDYANKWIISCGPKSLNNDCKKLANESRSRFFCEEYSL